MFICGSFCFSVFCDSFLAPAAASSTTSACPLNTSTSPYSQSEPVDHVRAVARHLLGLDDQVAFEVVEAIPAAHHVPQARQVTCARPAANLPGKAAVNGHRLRRILDSAHRRQSTVRAQRIVCGVVTAAHTEYAAGVPLYDAVQEAHGAAVRDEAGDLRAGHEHGVTATRR